MPLVPPALLQVLCQAFSWLRSFFVTVFVLQIDENLWPTADAMASALEAFYTNNLETLSTDLAGVPIVSFQIQRAPSVDQNGNPTTIYIGLLVPSSLLSTLHFGLMCVISVDCY